MPGCCEGAQLRVILGSPTSHTLSPDLPGMTLAAKRLRRPSPSRHHVPHLGKVDHPAYRHRFYRLSRASIAFI